MLKGMQPSPLHSSHAAALTSPFPSEYPVPSAVRAAYPHPSLHALPQPKPPTVQALPLLHSHASKHIPCFPSFPLPAPPQVLPQIIYYSAPDATADSALDFATLAVYVCPNSCCRSSPFSTAQQSSGTDPSSSTSTEDTAGGTSAERSSRDAGSGQAKGGEAATQHGGLQEQSMGYVEEFVWVQLPSQDPPVVASTD
ncbi:unnamed protein product [Closterium sp. NIES-54]